MKNIFLVLYLSLFLISCSQSKNISQQKNENNEKLQGFKGAQIKTMFQNGVDFFAKGSLPTKWQLTINYDDTVRFDADDGLALKFAYNQLAKEFLPDKTVYFVQLKAGSVVINIFEKLCTLSTINEVFKKEVTVSFNGKNYIGCGNFLATENLNNKWYLEKIGNTLLNSADYNKIPSIDFDIVKGEISGNDGCNTIGGKIEVQGKRIKFLTLYSTEMACNKKSIEKIISTQLSEKIVSYYFKDDKLYLYLPDDSLMIFKKDNQKLK